MQAELADMRVERGSLQREIGKLEEKRKRLQYEIEGLGAEPAAESNLANKPEAHMLSVPCFNRSPRCALMHVSVFIVEHCASTFSSSGCESSCTGCRGIQYETFRDKFFRRLPGAQKQVESSTKPTAWNLFLQEHYNSVAEKHPGAKHPDIVKEISSMWRDSHERATVLGGKRAGRPTTKRPRTIRKLGDGGKLQR